MKTNLLFPHSFKKVGWILFVPAIVLGVMVVFFDFEFDFLNCKVLAVLSDGKYLSGVFGEESNNWFQVINNNLTNELAGVLFILSAMFVAFSKEKVEDEFIAKLRLDSLLWSTYISYALLLLSFIFIYEFKFILAMIVSMFTTLIIFIIRFNVLLYKLKNADHEK